MARYIDADALIEELNSLSVTLCGKELFGELAKHSVVQKINEAPTADVAPIADTVRKMLSLLHEKKQWARNDNCDMEVFDIDDIDQIAKEMLEGDNEN